MKRCGDISVLVSISAQSTLDRGRDALTMQAPSFDDLMEKIGRSFPVRRVADKRILNRKNAPDPQSKQIVTRHLPEAKLVAPIAECNAVRRPNIFNFGRPSDSARPSHERLGRRADPISIATSPWNVRCPLNQATVSILQPPHIQHDPLPRPQAPQGLWN